MALTGLQIFKLLPKTNCGECGVPTCMAFAMKLAAKNAELAACPYASEEAKKTIGAASKPPIRLVKIGPPEREVAVGNETVMFRHEKTFVHPTALAIAFADDEPLAELCAPASPRSASTAWSAWARSCGSTWCWWTTSASEVEPFVAAGEGRGRRDRAAASSCGATNPEALEAALQVLEGQRPLIHAATPENAEAMAALALKYKAPLVARAATLDELAALTTKLAGAGREGHRARPAGREPRRRAAVQHHHPQGGAEGQLRAAGLPDHQLRHRRATLPSLVADASHAASASTPPSWWSTACSIEALLPLMMLRQNIYTDPQKPIQVEPKVYPIGEPGADSPVLVTTNFSLTYFIVSGEIENSGVPAHLVIVECEGMSVLTAWAAGKFSGAKIAARSSRRAAWRSR